MELLTSQIISPQQHVKITIPSTVQVHLGRWDEVVSRAYIQIFPLLYLYELVITWIAIDFGNGHRDVATMVLEGWPSIN